MHNYHDARNQFPVGAQGLPCPGMATPAPPRTPFLPFILPYFEQDNVYKLYDFTQGFNAAVNANAIGIKLQIFQCPTDDPRPQFTGSGGAMDYKGNYGLNWGRWNYCDQGGPSSNPAPLNVGAAGRSPFFERYGAKMADIADGTSNTLMWLEMLQGVGETAPLDRRGRLWNNDGLATRFRRGLRPTARTRTTPCATTTRNSAYPVRSGQGTI
jgi:hypothetical protein